VYVATFASGDVIGIALDMDAGTLTFYKNNTSQGTAFTSLSGLFSPTFWQFAGYTWNTNFGQRPFAYTPPTGFKALNTQNLPDATIKKGDAHFNAITSTATVSTGTTLSSLAYSPGLMWRKARSAAESHYLVDAVRGTGSGGYLVSNSTGVAQDYPNLDGTLTFNSNGYTITDSNWNVGEFYFNGRTYIDWIWNAGTTTVTNTSGSISAQVRANPTAGFSVVTYTGNGVTAATVGHGLNAIPAMVIIKERGTAGTNWMVKHQSLASSNNLFLQGTNATTNITSAVSGGGIANLSSSTTFNFLAGTVNTDNVNRNTGTFVAYCFAPVAGYSAFGNYTGNGSTDGPFVFTGFRPRFVLIKRSDSTGNWFIWDSSRNTYNAVNNQIYPDSSSAEAVQDGLDFLSNGFKIRFSSTFADRNANGGTYIYAAFAENPFKHSLAR
jgi:hypothetical protein